MFCTHCGKDIKEGSTFCAHCGSPVKVSGPDAGIGPEKAEAAESKTAEAAAVRAEAVSAAANPEPAGTGAGPAEDTIVSAFRASCKNAERFYEAPSIPPQILEAAENRLSRLGCSEEKIIAIYDDNKDGALGFILTDAAVYHFGAFMRTTVMKGDDCRRLSFKAISKIYIVAESGAIDDDCSMKMFIGGKEAVANYAVSNLSHGKYYVSLKEYALAVNAAVKSAQGRSVISVELDDEKTAGELGIPEDSTIELTKKGKLLLQGIFCALGAGFAAGIGFFVKNLVLIPGIVLIIGGLTLGGYSVLKFMSFTQRLLRKQDVNPMFTMIYSLLISILACILIAVPVMRVIENAGLSFLVWASSK